MVSVNNSEDKGQCDVTVMMLYEGCSEFSLNIYEEEK